MTIADLIERSNPEDLESLLEQERAGNGQIGPVNTKPGRVHMNAFIIAILLLSTSASFGLGYLAGHEANQSGGLIVGSVPMTSPGTGVVSESALSAAAGSAGATSTQGNPSAIPAGGEVVASKMIHSYFLPWCSGAAKITNNDKVWFANEQAAKDAGYKAGKNCSGI